MSLHNIDKILSYVNNVAKSDFKVEGKVYHYTCRDIFISPTIFLKDGCEMCGRCDVPQNIVLTRSEYQMLCDYDLDNLKSYDPSLPKDYMEKLKHDLHPDSAEIVSIDSKGNENISTKHDFVFYEASTPFSYRYTNDRGFQVACAYAIQLRPGYIGCGIHPVRSITCRMPHLHIAHNEKHGSYIRVMQFGRNWLLGCPFKFQVPYTDTEFQSCKSSVIDKLNRLKLVCDDTGIDTWMNEILDTVHKLEFTYWRDLYKKNELLPVVKSGIYVPIVKTHTVKLFNM